MGKTGWSFVFGLLLLTNAAFAAPFKLDRVSITYPISSPLYPVILTGKQLPTLLETPIEKIRFYRWNKNRLESIPFQIDRRDKDKRYYIPKTDRDRAREASKELGENDECALMASDLGERLSAPPPGFRYDAVMEIELIDPNNGQRAWVYAFVSVKELALGASLDYVSYDPNNDRVEGATYLLGYSKKLPFLIDTARWRLRDDARFSADIVDIMKIRHTGKLFHRFHFHRTQNDYKSKLIAVKDGPVRVIRRTANRVRMVWGIHSPKVYIDSIHYRYGFVMDIIVDFPFRIGLLFSDIDAVPTIDGTNDASLPQAFIHSPSMLPGMPINGKMSEAKKQFNATKDTAFAITSAYGTVVSDISVEKGSPIRNQVYLIDDLTVNDPPEEIPGLFGNVGFNMTEWDKLDSQTHHILFRAYMLHDNSVERVFRFLRDSPSFSD